MNWPKLKRALKQTAEDIFVPLVILGGLGLFAWLSFLFVEWLGAWAILIFGIVILIIKVLFNYNDDGS